MKHKTILIVIIILFLSNVLTPCTTAIISGRVTSDGRPLLWKNRDTDDLDNVLKYFISTKYDFIALVNSKDTNAVNVWQGMNSAGFAIMNSVSYNIYTGKEIKNKDKEGVVMKLALGKCATVDDFEKLLNSLEKPMGLETNFGVIDACGNAAYFETDHYTYKKFDINDPEVAPDGYMLRTNFSICGKEDIGQGYERFTIEEELFKNARTEKKINVKFILQDVARCLRHGITRIDLKEECGQDASEIKFVPFIDFIPRYYTSASVVIQGAKNEKDLGNMVMWTVLGFPPCSVVYPVWFNKEGVLPEILSAGKNGNALLCDYALMLKEKCFPIKRGRGMNYININALYNKSGTGIMQILQPLENEIFDYNVPQKDAVKFYNILDNKIKKFFGELIK